MPVLAELLGQTAAGRLAAARAEAARREAAAAATPVRPVCESCGQPLPPPAAVFLDGRGP